MNRQFFVQLSLTLAGVLLICSCRPANDLQQSIQGNSEPGSEHARPDRQQQQSNEKIRMLDELKAELDRVAQGEDSSRVLESALLYAESLDDSVDEWNGTSAFLANRFNDLVRLGNPKDEFFERFGLAGHVSEQEPKIEVEMLVRTVGSLSANRPDLLQELLSRMATDASQSESDLVVYASAVEYVMEYSGNFRNAGYSGIVSLRDSENPIYRLLAAKLMPVLELDLDLLADFYNPYATENDEMILIAAIDGLTTSGAPLAIATLGEIASNNHGRSSLIVASAERALELIEDRQPE